MLRQACIKSGCTTPLRQLISNNGSKKWHIRRTWLQASESSFVAYDDQSIFNERIHDPTHVHAQCLHTNSSDEHPKTVVVPTIKRHHSYDCSFSTSPNSAVNVNINVSEMNESIMFKDLPPFNQNKSDKDFDDTDSKKINALNLYQNSETNALLVPNVDTKMNENNLVEIVNEMNQTALEPTQEAQSNSQPQTNRKTIKSKNGKQNKQTQKKTIDKDKINPEMNQNQASNILNDKLAKAIRGKNVEASMDILQMQRHHNNCTSLQHKRILFHTKNLVNLLRLTGKRGDIDSFHQVIRQLHIQQTVNNGTATNNNDENDMIKPTSLSKTNLVPASVYNELFSKGYDTPTTWENIQYLFVHLQSLNLSTHQQKIFPHFFYFVLSHQNIKLKRYLSSPIWYYMAKNNISCSTAILEKTLQYSYVKAAYHRATKNCHDRKSILPFDHILEQLVEDGIRPQSSNVMETLNNYFPYKDSKSTKSILESIQQLYKTKSSPHSIISESTSRSSKTAHHLDSEYSIPFGTLESIATSCAQTGNVDLMLLVWDLVELMGYKPNQHIYENSICVFIKAYQQDHNAFAVLSNMEDNGVTPSRALIQSVADSLSYTIGRTSNAYYIVTNESNGTKISLSSLNCIIAAFAKLGHVNYAFSTYDEFESYNIDPDVNTFSYLIEALATDIRMKSTSNIQQQSCGSQCEAVDALYSIMSQMQIEPNSNVIHNHACILVSLKEREKAKSLIIDAVDKKIQVRLQTVRMLADSFLSQGDANSAQEVYDLMKITAKQHDGENIVDVDLRQKLETYARGNVIS